MTLRTLGISIVAWVWAAGCVPGGAGSGGDPTDGDVADRAVADGGDADAGACLPDCAERTCGDDGCGATCGDCAGGLICDRAGLCVDLPAQCGDGACGDDEDCATCPADCGDCCGDGQCAAAEDCATCPADCACPEGRSCTGEGLCEPEGCIGEGCGAPPRILTFNANVRALTEGGEVVLSAVVTDPDGIADLIGGVLEDPGGASYGSFATAGEEGAYGLTLTWGDLHALRPIEFDGEATRTIVAAFFDQSGNRSTETIELTLHCRDAGAAACDGVCASLDSAEHCGACGAVCEDECRDRRCQCPPDLLRCDGACIPTDADPQNCGGCGETCPGAVGGAPVCVDGRCGDPCPGATEDCGGACTDTDTAVAHCGGCDRVCEAPENGAPACRAGRCEVDCEPDHRLCDAACAPCPVEGTARTACLDGACVARGCEDGFRLCGDVGVCARCPAEAVRETTCAGDRCIAAECDQGFHRCAEGCCPWRFEPLVEGRANVALAVDDAGPHVAIGERAVINYGRRVDGEWIWEEAADLGRDVQSFVEVSIALTQGVVHLAYAGIFPPPPGGRAPSTLRYLRRQGGAWRDVAGIAGGRSIVEKPSLATHGEQAWLAFEAGTAQVVDPAVGFGNPDEVTEGAAWTPHLAAGADGALHLTWWNLAERTLGYARRAPGAIFERGDPTPDVASGTYPRIAADGAGLPAILHMTEDARLMLTRFDGESWDTTDMAPGETVFFGHDLIRGLDGRLLACYGSNMGFFVLEEADGGWRRDEVRNGDVGLCRLAVGPDGALHVTFQADGGMHYGY